MTFDAVQPLPLESLAERPVVSVEDVGKMFGSAQGGLPALKHVSLRVHRGDVFGIIGRSGAGKSTLIRLLNRLDVPTSGRVLVHDVDIGHLDEGGLAVLRRGMGMIFQHFNLLSAKTVGDNVALPLRVAGLSRRRIQERVAAVLDLVGLTDKHDVYPARLSGGQKQRVGIARALVHEPDILLCDEPTSALDPESTVSILGLLRDLNQRLGITIILITHEMAVIREICGHVAVLEKGEVVETGPVWRVFGDPQHPATLALLRPLGQILPEEFAGRLRPEPGGGAERAILSVGFVGHDQSLPDLGDILTMLGGEAKILFSDIERIQGRAVGRMLLSVPAATAGVAVRPALGGLSVFPRVLGYLDDAAR
jgi:D-methionine transport system ATP-binding protein